jgi:hypothetical protein
MSNVIKLKRTNTPNKVPTISDIQLAEMAYNYADQKVYISDGSTVHQINHASFITTDATHRFVTDTQISDWEAIASASVLGRVKIGSNINVDSNGVISLNIADTGTTGLLSAADWNTFNDKQDALGYVPVNKAGDTMTGALTLSGAPTSDNHASTKKYVDDGLALKLSLSGGTMTGALTLAADPTNNLHATTKQYVDGQVNAVSGKYAAPVQTLTALAGVTSYEDKQIRLVEDAGALFRFDAQSTDAAAAGDVIVPDNITAPDPGRWIKVQAATQSHNLLTGLQGGAEGDYLHLTTSEKNSYDAHLTDNSVHLTSAQNTWLDAIVATSDEVNYLAGATSNIQTQIDGKQATITGAATTITSSNLTIDRVLVSNGSGKVAVSSVTASELGYLSGATSSLQTQLDGKLSLSGGTMTGTLTLDADPVNALEAATKQYVDAQIAAAVIDGGTF